VVGTDCVDARPSLMLVCDDVSYLFNVGEGTQRLCEEYRIKLPKLGHVFFSRCDWRAMGGFPGMMLTMSDVGGEQLGIHGPPNTLQFLASLRYFVKRPDLALHVAPPGATFADGNVTVRSFLIPSQLDTAPIALPPPVEAAETNVGWVAPSADGSVMLGLGRRRAEGQAKPAKQQKKFSDPAELGEGGLVREPVVEESHPMSRLVPPGAPRHVAVCWELKLADVRGKFDVERAKALGIKPGKLCSELIKGNTVRNADGVEVAPHQCVGANVAGPTTVIVDCPDALYAPALFACRGLQESLERAATVVHIGDQDVVASPEYEAWIRRHCGADAMQLTLGAACSQGSVFRSAAAVQGALAKVSPIFAAPCERPRRTAPCPAWLRPCSIGDSLVLAPPKLAGFLPCPPRAAMALNEPDPQHLLAPGVAAEWREGEVEVGFLGTGASRPSKYRNVTSQFVSCGSKGAALILDCGEGTLGQLTRLRGEGACAALLARLSCIAVSHLHADHHLGLASLLWACSGKQVAVVCPPPLCFWGEELREWHTPPPRGWTEQWFECTRLPDIASSIGLSFFSAVPVVHCPLSYGFVLEWPWQGRSFRVVYSGDTRPCERLEVAGQGADLLIHEATFEDSMQDDAVHKRHSTVSEAVGSGERMGATHTVLTHFSQRYPKSVESGGRAALAWDMMCFQPHHLAALPLLSSLARNVFPDTDEPE
jgi:ribonuclease Z